VAGFSPRPICGHRAGDKRASVYGTGPPRIRASPRLDHEAGSCGVAAEDAHQLRVNLDISDRVLGLGLEVPGRLDPDQVVVPLEGAPFQPVDLDPPQTRAQGQQEGEEDRGIVAHQLLLGCPAHQLLLGCPAHQLLLGCPGQLGRVDAGPSGPIAGARRRSPQRAAARAR
jgi:hypothetical protein